MRHPAHWTTAACPKLSLGCIWHQFHSRAKLCTAINISHHNVSPSTSPTATIDNAQCQIHASHPLNDDGYMERPSLSRLACPGIDPRDAKACHVIGRRRCYASKKEEDDQEGRRKGQEGQEW